MWFDDWNPAYQVEKNLYCSSPYHKLIGVLDSPGNPSFENIGKNGKNLSIGILSMNRAELTIRLMDSIAEVMPDFEGIFLIADNGSAPSELEKIYQHTKDVPFQCQIEELGKNYGVAGGRNRMMRLAKTDWILSVDNDMVFTCNILPQAQEDIATLGVQFMSVPFVNNHDVSNGMMVSHIIMENIDGKVNIGLGRTLDSKEFRINEPIPGFLCTGLIGTAAFINKHTFLHMDGFDEGMFVGFEDIEFSMRLFQAGYKVGAMAMVGMSHNHVETKKDADREYEKVRFKHQLLYEAAMHFERKHGVGVWNRVASEWIRNRRAELNLESAPHDKEEKKKKVALIIDRPDWALDHIAEQVIRWCSDDFDFVRYYTADIDNLADLLIAAQDCDVIHFFWRGLINWYYDSYAQGRITSFGYTEAEFREKYLTCKLVTTSVYDHLYLKEGETAITEKLFASPETIVNGYTVSSQRLKDIYDNIPGLLMRPDAVVTDGVDLDRFKPLNLERFSNINERTIYFGWVGNSNWKWVDTDLKGLQTIIKPAVEELKQQGYNIELLTSDRDQKMIPHYRMPRFYEKIDCYLCASLHEGTPNPVLEAMACGVPVISTDVGLIPQLFGSRQMEFVLKERTKDEMVRLIKKLLDNPEAFAELSSENLESIKSWDWRICAQRFIPFWKKLLEAREAFPDFRKPVGLFLDPL